MTAFRAIFNTVPRRKGRGGHDRARFIRRGDQEPRSRRSERRGWPRRVRCSAWYRVLRRRAACRGVAAALWIADDQSTTEAGRGGPGWGGVGRGGVGPIEVSAEARLETTAYRVPRAREYAHSYFLSYCSLCESMCVTFIY